jgi:hypothetical protein
MADVGSYRIRWAVVTILGRRDCRERMCIAERRYGVLGLRFWFPFQAAEWRRSEGQALRDIEWDKALRAPLPAARQVI